MNKTARVIFILFILSSAAYADDFVKSFTFQTIDGKKVEYNSASGTPMVINVGSHW
jgi:hypothetical protein